MEETNRHRRTEENQTLEERKVQKKIRHGEYRQVTDRRTPDMDETDKDRRTADIRQNDR